MRDTTTRRKFLAATGGAASTILLSGCMDDGGGNGGDGGNGGGLSGQINIAGSSTVFPLATAIAEEFRRQHPDVEISISSTGSGGGFQNHFCPGNTDFNNASRPIQPEEEQLCSENGVEPVELKVATDALTVVVNNDADWVDCVTVEELEQIWQPNGATSWSDVRSEWPDQEFELYGAASTSGTFDYFTEVVMGEEGRHRQDYSATERDRNIVQGVSGSEAAMGYFGFSYYFNNPDQVKALEIENPDTGECVAPGIDTASSGAYSPLARPLFTYPATDALAEEHVAEFARFFVGNSTNEDIVAQQVGYVPNTEETMQEMLDRLNQAIEEAQG